MITAFELQTFQGGTWKIDSIFDDRESVIFEAKRLAETGRYTGVRVVQETHDADTNSSSYRIIYKGGRAEKENRKAHRRERQVKTEVAVAKKDIEEKCKQKEREERQRKAKAESNRWYIMLAIKGGGLVFLALVLLIGLNILSEKF